MKEHAPLYLQDYIDRQMATFESKPFNPVDAGVFTQVTMIRSMGIIPGLKERATFADGDNIVLNASTQSQHPVKFLDMLRAEYFNDMFSGHSKNELKELLYSLTASPRFREVCVRDYLSLFDVERETQFAALTFTYGEEFAVICFRGTDATLTGWKEDFNMMFSMPVPAQAQACQYVETVAPHLPKKIYICGHSKGGNLAEYAALKVKPDVQERIEQVYIFDGPGFKEGTFTKEDYAPIIDRMYKIVPRDSIIGLLLESPLPLHVVPSRNKGFQEHNLFSWQVAGLTENKPKPKFTIIPGGRTESCNPSPSVPITDVKVRSTLSDDALDDITDEKVESHGEEVAKPSASTVGTDFVYLPDISENSKFTAQALANWIAPYDDKKREEMVESLFRLMRSTGFSGISDIFSGSPESINALIDAATKSDNAADLNTVLNAGRDLFASVASLMTRNLTGDDPHKS